MLHALWRFDAELAKVTDSLKTEKQLRDKLQRERDELVAEKYATDQQLKVSTAFCFVTYLLLDLCFVFWVSN